MSSHTGNSASEDTQRQSSPTTTAGLRCQLSVGPPGREDSEGHLCPGVYDVRSLLGTQGKTVKGRVLVIADGATSKLAMQMGYCTEPPKGVCSRAFIEGGTHNVDFDGAHPYLSHAI